MDESCRKGRFDAAPKRAAIRTLLAFSFTCLSVFEPERFDLNISNLELLELIIFIRVEN